MEGVELPQRAQEALTDLVRSLEIDGVEPMIEHEIDGTITVVWHTLFCRVAATIGHNEEIIRFSFFK